MNWPVHPCSLTGKTGQGKIVNVNRKATHCDDRKDTLSGLQWWSLSSVKLWLSGHCARWFWSWGRAIDCIGEYY
jgi:hypothetical protein